MVELNWTHEARVWLRGIYEYIAEDDPETAKRTVDSIFQRAQVLKEFPRIGHRYEDYAAAKIRILLYGHYRIAYFIKSKAEIVILGVFHGALDLERHLR